MNATPPKGRPRDDASPRGRWFSGALVRGALRRPSGWVLLAVNLGLVWGVLQFGWSVFQIVFLYWAENVVIGAYNVLRMAVSNPGGARLAPDGTPAPKRGTIELVAGIAQKLFLIPFFVVHYGMFCYGHGVFVVSIFGRDGDHGDDLLRAMPDILTLPLGVSLALLALSHGYSFVANFIGRGEYRRVGVAEMMFRPYGRIVVLHIAIILGGGLTVALGSPLAMLLVLMVLKTVVDLAMHEREREKLDPETPIIPAHAVEGSRP